MIGETHNISKYQFLHHFFPHKTNKTRARLLTNEALVTYALLQVLILAIVRVVPLLVPGILGYASNINTADLFKHTNEQRAKVGLNTLTLNNKLSVAAQKKAEDMFKVGYWAHVSPLGAKPWDFILGQSYDYVYAGENLAKNFSKSKDVVEAWYASPSHRDNLLSSNYDDVGFAIVNGVLDGYETTIVVQMFGRARVPAPVAKAPEPVPTKKVAVNEPVVEEIENTVPAIEELPEAVVESAPTELPKVLIPETLPIPVELTEPTLSNVEGDLTPILQQLTASENLVVNDAVETTPVVDIKLATKSIIYAFGGFLLVLLGIDIWYSKKHGILKVTGHTLAHLMFLAVVLISVVLSIVPGAIL